MVFQKKNIKVWKNKKSCNTNSLKGYRESSITAQRALVSINTEHLNTTHKAHFKWFWFSKWHSSTMETVLCWIKLSFHRERFTLKLVDTYKFAHSPQNRNDFRPFTDHLRRRTLYLYVFPLNILFVCGSGEMC